MENVKRYGMVIGIKKEKIDEYKKLHANVWSDVLSKIKKCNISNYSIYLGQMEPDKYYLFSYLEYIGDDLEADMAKMAADETTQKWWKLCKPCQIPLECRYKNEWWMNMEEVFHCD
jgi:L-rhamnose mutarotase